MDAYEDATSGVCSRMKSLWRKTRKKWTRCSLVRCHMEKVQKCTTTKNGDDEWAIQDNAKPNHFLFGHNDERSMLARRPQRVSMKSRWQICVLACHNRILS